MSTIDSTGVEKREESLWDHLTPPFRPTSLESLLWVGAVVTLVADFTLTYAGIQHGLTEGNPVVAGSLEVAGFWLFGLLKLGALGLAGAVRQARPTCGPVIALGIALPWGLAALLNFITLLGQG